MIFWGFLDVGRGGPGGEFAGVVGEFILNDGLAPNALSAK